MGWSGVSHARRHGRGPHLFVGGHLLQLLVQNVLELAGLLADIVLWAVEEIAVLEDLAHVGNKVVGGAVAGGKGLGSLGRIRVLQFRLDRGKVHRALDDNGIVRNVERNGVDWMEKVVGVLEALERAGSRDTKLVLVRRHCRGTRVGRGRGVLERRIRSKGVCLET